MRTATPKDVSARVRDQITRHGDRRVSAVLGVSRYTCLRMAAGQPVIEAVLFAAKSRLPALERELSAERAS